MTWQALVLDFGGPVILTPFELVRAFERRTGLPPGTFDWTGPFDPAKDPLWRRMQADEISERDYWAIRTEEVAAATGCRADFHSPMARLYPSDEIDSFTRPQAFEAVRAAKAVGLRTAVLSNDIARFYDEDWISRVSFFKEVDAVVDVSHGVLKPDPAAYRLVLDALEVPAEAALFVDDQPRNIDGARAIGMPALLFDVTRPSESYREVARLLGLPELDDFGPFAGPKVPGATADGKKGSTDR